MSPSRAGSKIGDSWEPSRSAIRRARSLTEVGVGARLVRHDEWHGEGAYFDEVQYLVINDPNARQTALVTGDVDACGLLENKTLTLL